jgi:hypothetical protein
VPDLGAGAERRGISNVYTYEGTLVFVVDTLVVTSAARELDATMLLPARAGGAP